MTVAEETQEKGREGVMATKRWLESTTYFDLPCHVYQRTGKTEVRFAPGKDGLKRFDLAGFRLAKTPISVWVEAKSYSSAGSLGTMFNEMLAVAYGNIRFKRENGETDGGDEFIFATDHPFSLGAWSKLATPDQVKKAFESDQLKKYVGNDAFDYSLAHLVAERTWLLVASHRQSELELTTEEVLVVLG